jgi:hypothetical protein
VSAIALSPVSALPVSLPPQLRVSTAEVEHMPIYLRTFFQVLSSWVHSGRNLGCTRGEIVESHPAPRSLLLAPPRSSSRGDPADEPRLRRTSGSPSRAPQVGLGRFATAWSWSAARERSSQLATVGSPHGCEDHLAPSLAWRMHRQLLHPIGRLPVAGVVRRLRGVQAQVASSAELAIRLRRETSRPSEVDRELRPVASSRPGRCEAALHLLTPKDAGAFLSLMAAGRAWERPSWQRYFEMTAKEWMGAMDALRHVVREALAEKPLTCPVTEFWRRCGPSETTSSPSR